VRALNKLQIGRTSPSIGSRGFRGSLMENADACEACRSSQPARVKPVQHILEPASRRAATSAALDLSPSWMRTGHGVLAREFMCPSCAPAAWARATPAPKPANRARGADLASPERLALPNFLTVVGGTPLHSRHLSSSCCCCYRCGMVALPVSKPESVTLMSLF
jgi:hypothetical protein